MPKPTPKAGEERDVFMGRCMKDTVMNSEYADDDQRSAVCTKAFREGQKVNEAKEDGKELIAEIFAVGKWNDLEFSRDDLEGIAETFTILGERHRVPLKMGHNEDQPMVDGHMALGWVEKVWVEADKLMAKFVALPPVVYSAIQQKRFRNVSIELDIDVDHRGESFRHVLSGVALLGADIPAVNTLADLQTYLHNRDRFTAQDRMYFTVLEGDKMGDQNGKGQGAGANNGSDTELQARFDAEKARAEKFERELQDLKDKQKKDEFAQKRSDFTSRLDALVEAKRITPATRDKFTSQVKEDDEAAFDKVAFAIETLEEVGGQVDFGRKTGDQAKQGDGPSGGDDGKDRDPGEFIAEKAHTFARQHKMAYRDAVFAVMREHPEIAEQYRNTGIEHLKS